MNILTQDKTVTMTSQQIAELVGKRHDSVKRTIDYLAKEGAIQLPHDVEVKNHLGQMVVNYIFSGEQGRLDSITVVAQLSPTFTSALVKRWDELEKQQAQPAFQIPQSYGEALQLAANQALQIEQDKPKVDHYNAVVKRKGLLNATQVGLKLGMSAIALNRILEELGVYNKSVQRSRVFKKAFIDKGYGVLKQTEQGQTQSLFTLAGEAWVIEKLQCEGVA